MPVTSCSSNNTKANFSGHVIITTIIKSEPKMSLRQTPKSLVPTDKYQIKIKWNCVKLAKYHVQIVKNPIGIVSILKNPQGVSCKDFQESLISWKFKELPVSACNIAIELCSACSVEFSNNRDIALII